MEGKGGNVSAWRRSLVGRLVSYFLPLSLLTVATSGALVYAIARQALESAVVDRSTVFATLAEDELLRWIEARRREVVFVASLSELSELAAPLVDETASVEAREEAHLRLGRLGDRILASHPDVRELMVLSNVGGRIAYSTDVAHEGSYRVQDEFFVSGREGTFVQGVYPSPLTLRPTVTVSTPLRRENLGTFGILAAHLDLEALDRLMQRRAGLGVSGETYLVDSYHSFISAERFGRERFPRGVHTEGIDAAIGGRDGAALYANYAGVPVIGVFRWIDDLDLALLVEVSQREAFAPLRRIALTILATALLAAVVVALGTVIVARQVVEPIRGVTEAAQRVAGGDLEARAPIVTDDELGVLGRSFNEMTARLGVMYEDLQHENAERRRAEASQRGLISELEGKNEELERFAYTLSHDLKAPLVTIRGFLGVLANDIEDGHDSRALEDIGRIEEAVQRMRLLLDELLELSRIGRLTNPSEDVPLQDIVEEALKLVRGAVDQRGVVVQVADDLPVVHGDRARLVDVLQNLVENAAKFMGDQEHPRVEIGVRSEGGEPAVFVKDNGMGIEPRYQERVFGLFERLDSQSDGTGIGLAIVKRILEVHGSRVWIESAGRGKGATFCFTIPVGDAE